MVRLFNLPYDKGGEIADKGKNHINHEIVNMSLANNFFKLPLPKSIDKKYFDYIINIIDEYYISKYKSNAYVEIITLTEKYSIISTVTEITVMAIVEAISLFKLKYANIYIAGGGIYNDYLIKRIFTISSHKKITELNQINFLRCNISKKNIYPEYIESQGMAFLAARFCYVKPSSFKYTTGINKNNIILGDLVRY
ncbi:MAG TPA: anhydro-N-acetylmuramic acid kinase [Candidatus Megaira endosymbiont of Hartmannula sinica]|nr:anhydro-N-acetylmuramic acid kinase [Candidatus Megaera endosymbiont of Hartmannula sinica]